MITKTALGAEDTVAWQHSSESAQLLRQLRAANYEIAAVETSAHAVDLFDWQPRFPVCVLFGHETDGLEGRFGTGRHAHPDSHAGPETLAERRHCGRRGFV